MKWLPNRESQRRNIRGKLPLDEYLPKSTLVVGLIVFLIGTGIFVSANISKLKNLFISDSFSNSLKKIDNVAANISVKILDKEFLGSGFIVQRTNNQYVVITNQHVLRAGEAPYRVQTPDGKIHLAEVVTTESTEPLTDSIKGNHRYDLAILKFNTEVDYPVAEIGSSLYLEVGEPIYAVGFPYTEVESEASSKSVDSNQTSEITGLTIKTGRVAIILNQALVEGYQIGYTNDVKKGMSGGPLLNSRGEVVGVNGKHAYPLWESPELYQDGSQPCPALEKLITRSSLAIPIERSIELDSQLMAIRPRSDAEVTRRSDLLSEDPELVAKMQSEAEATAQSCQQYGKESTNSLSETGIEIENEE